MRPATRSASPIRAPSKVPTNFTRKPADGDRSAYACRSQSGNCLFCRMGRRRRQRPVIWKRCFSTQPNPFDPRKLLRDSLLAEKAQLLAELPQAAEPRLSVIREEIAACESLLARVRTRRLISPPLRLAGHCSDALVGQGTGWRGRVFTRSMDRPSGQLGGRFGFRRDACAPARFASSGRRRCVSLLRRYPPDPWQA